MKKAAALLLAWLMCLAVFSACGRKDPTPSQEQATPSPGGTAVTTAPEPPSETDHAAPCTYRIGSESFPNNWNPHLEGNDIEKRLISFITSPLVRIAPEDTEDGSYRFVFEMASEINDVTGAHTDDLKKYGSVTGSAQDEMTGYVYEVKIRSDARWENGERITADDYIRSIKLLLDPDLDNPAAKELISGYAPLAGAARYHSPATETQYLPLSSLGYENSVQAIEAGEELCIDMWALCGFEGALDPEGNECPQWADVTDTTPYSMGAPETALSPAKAWEFYRETVDSGENTGLCAVKKTVRTDLRPFEEVVGCYKVDDTTFNYVCLNKTQRGEFMMTCTNYLLVYAPLYEAGVKTEGGAASTDYGTGVYTTVSSGPYRISYIEDGALMTLVRNPAWYGWETDQDGAFVSHTVHTVNGEHVLRFNATRILISSMGYEKIKQSFLRGALSEWDLGPADAKEYKGSPCLYETPTGKTLFMLFDADEDRLAEYGELRGDENPAVFSDPGVRMALSRITERGRWASEYGGEACLGLLNGAYYCDRFSSSGTVYRDTEAAKEAILAALGIEYGPGAAYANAEKAYAAAFEADRGAAGALLREACARLAEAGLYEPGSPVVITVGFGVGASRAEAESWLKLIENGLNTAAIGTGFGKFVFNAVMGERECGFTMRFITAGGDVFRPGDALAGIVLAAANGTGGGLLSEKVSVRIRGVDHVKTWGEWISELSGEGSFFSGGGEDLIAAAAQLEGAFLAEARLVPIASVTHKRMLALNVKPFTADWDPVYGRGGFELMEFNMTDDEWEAAVTALDGSPDYH